MTNNPTQSENYELGVQAIRFLIRNCSLEQWGEAIDQLDEAHKQKMARIWYTVELPYGEVGYENE